MHRPMPVQSRQKANDRKSDCVRIVTIRGVRTALPFAISDVLYRLIFTLTPSPAHTLPLLQQTLLQKDICVSLPFLRKSAKTDKLVFHNALVGDAFDIVAIAP